MRNALQSGGTDKDLETGIGSRTRPLFGGLQQWLGSWQGNGQPSQKAKSEIRRERTTGAEARDPSAAIFDPQSERLAKDTLDSEKSNAEW